MANWDSLAYTQGAKVRATSEQPEWFSFTVTIPDGKALADNDALRFAVFGANQKILAYSLGCDASLGTADADTADLYIGAYRLDDSIENNSLAVADYVSTEFISVAHVTADGDILKVDTEAALNSQTTSGVRKITLAVLVAQQNAADAASGLVEYESRYTL